MPRYDGCYRSNVLRPDERLIEDLEGLIEYLDGRMMSRMKAAVEVEGFHKNLHLRLIVLFP